MQRSRVDCWSCVASAGGISPDFNDYRVSLSKTLASGWTAAAQVTENTNTRFYNGTRSNLNENDTRDFGKRRVAVSLSKRF